MALLGSCDKDTYRLRSKLVSSARKIQASRRYRRRNICSVRTTPSSAESSTAALMERSDRARLSTTSLTKKASVWSSTSTSAASRSSQRMASS